MSSAPSSPARAAARIAVVSRPSAAGSSSTFQAAAVCSRADASPSGRPPGNRSGSAPASRAPRSPARRGTQANRAPVAAANLLAAESAPGEVASRSPTRMSAPGSFSCASSGRPSSAAASAPGAHSMSLPAIFVSPRVANGAIDITCSAFLRAALRSRRNTIGDSSSGSKPTSRTAGALVQVRVGDRHRLAGRRARRGTRSPRHCAAGRGSRCRWCPALSARTSSRRRRPRRWPAHRPGLRRCRSRPPARPPRRRGLPTRTRAAACRPRRERAGW